MQDNIHLAVAGFVFLMLLIGVVLTIIEFRRLIRDSEEQSKRDSAEAEPGQTRKE